MLLAAGELIATGQPVSVDSWGEGEDPWASWLADHIDAASERWTVDLREASPLEPETYGRLKPMDKWRERTVAEYDEELCLDRGDDQIVVHAYTQVNGEDRYGYAHVSSALVSPESASALQRALQSCDPREFRLPEEGDSAFSNDLVLDQPGFRLLGWIAEQRIEEAGMEEYDPLRRIGLSFARPGQTFAENRGLRIADGGRRMLDDKGQRVVWTELWSDERLPLRYERRISYSAGARVFVKLPELLAFLSAQEMDLIIEVRLTRQYAERRLKEEHSYEPGESRLYLLRRDGASKRWGVLAS